MTDEVKRLRKALEFYAEERYYAREWENSLVCYDQGKTAREALAFDPSPGSSEWIDRIIECERQLKEMARDAKHSG